jgi:hypothetical protein
MDTRRPVPRIEHDVEEIVEDVEHLVSDIFHPHHHCKLTRIEIQFRRSNMATAGPVTLTSVGQTVTASVLGFDQFGNPWTGPLPTVNLTSDDTSSAIVTFDPATGLVTAVANGVANITATLTTTEGAALADTEAVTVAIPIVPPPVPVLSSIKVAFA